jgi:hypothetical protein
LTKKIKQQKQKKTPKDLKTEFILTIVNWGFKNKNNTDIDKTEM